MRANGVFTLDRRSWVALPKLVTSLNLNATNAEGLSGNLAGREDVPTLAVSLGPGQTGFLGREVTTPVLGSCVVEIQCARDIDMKRCGWGELDSLGLEVVYEDGGFLAEKHSDVAASRAVPRVQSNARHHTLFAEICSWPPAGMFVRRIYLPGTQKLSFRQRAYNCRGLYQVPLLVALLSWNIATTLRHVSIRKHGDWLGWADQSTCGI